MSDPLASYLHDHLAGSHFAIELLKTLQNTHREQPLADFARGLESDVKQDQDTLRDIIHKVGEAPLDWTETAGWLAQRASQLKLKEDDSRIGLGTFEALETLTLGIRGKLALWQALPIIRNVDSRVPIIDYAKLMERAEEQYNRVEKQRLELAATTFGIGHR